MNVSFLCASAQSQYSCSLFQTFLKVLTLAQRGLFYEMSRQTAWDVLNDLIAHGVDKQEYEIVVRELLEMHLIKIGVNCQGEETISLLSAALGDIAFDVCTPEQINSICKEILDRVAPLQDKDFRVPFLMASFHYRLDGSETAMVQLWKKGYAMLLNMRDEFSESRFNMILEEIDEEVSNCGYNPQEVFGIGFKYPPVNENPIGTNFLLVKL